MAEKFSLTAQLNLQAPKNVKQVFGQIQKQLSGATVNVNVAKSAQAVKDLNKIATATKAVQTESKKASSGADKMGKAFGSALKNVLRYDLARRVFTAFTNTIEQGIQDAIKFEREMIKIAQVSGQTMQQLKGLENTVSRLSTTLGVSSSSLVKVGLILKQTGLSVKDTEIAMKALAKTDLAPTFDNIADTAETAVAAMRQFGLEASRLESLLGKINTVAANFAVEASDIGVAIKRAGGAFKAAGGEVEELISLFTSVRATTRETAETIATGFRTIFTRLQRPTTIKFLRQFGIELTDLKGKFVGPYEAVRRLSNALSGLDPRDLRFSMIVEQLGGFRQVSKVIPMIQQFNTAQAAMKAQMEGSGSLAKDAATAQQSLAVQIQKLTENVKELFREVTQSESFQALAKMALGLANAITKIGKALAPVLPILGAFVAARAAAWAGGKLFGGGVGGLNNALGSAMGDTSDVYKGNRGGRVPKRFSRGGWVPGTGNGDTVPALLEPGEFVLRKSAAQAFGSRLNGINKYGKGDIVGVESINRVYDGDSFNISAYPKSGAFDTSTRLIGYDAPELSKAGRKAFAAVGATHPADLARDEMASYMQRRGGNLKNQFFKNTPDGRKSLGLSTDGRFRPLFNAPGHGKNLVSKGLAAKGRDKFDMANYVRTSSNLNDEQRSKLIEKGFNKGGLVPSLLTPGEFVVNKKSAQAMGYGKLRSMNRYKNGGTVGGGGGGTAIVSGSRGASMALEDLRENAVQGAKGLYQVGEAATMGAAQNIAVVTGMGALAEQLGMGGSALDFWTGTLSTSAGILGGFNAAIDQANSSGFMDQLGGFADMLGDKDSKIGGILDSFGDKLSKKGGVLGKVGTGMKGMGGGLQKTLGNVQDLRDKGIFHKGVSKYEGQAARIEAKRASLEARPERFRQKALTQAKRAEAMKGTASNLGKRAGAKFAEQKALHKQMDAITKKGGGFVPKGMSAEYKRLGDLAEEAGKAGKALRGQGRAASDAAKKFATSSSTHMKNSAKAAKTAKAMAPQLTKAAKGAKFAAMGLKALNPVALIAEVAIGKLGDAIEKDALKKIGTLDFESGESTAGQEGAIKAQAAAGGALKGGATGAGIGAAIGSIIPGLGTAVGAVVGGVIGAAWGAISAWMNAAKMIEQAKFNSKLKAMGQAMDNYSKGLTDSDRVASSIAAMDTAIEDFGASMKMEDVIAAQKEQYDTAHAVLEAEKGKAKSVDEFLTSNAKLINGMKERSDITQKEIDAKVKDIEVRLKAEKAMENFVKEQERHAKRLARLRNISGIFDELTARMSAFGGVLSGIANPTGSVNVGSLSAAMRPEGKDKESIKRYDSMIDLLGNIGGESPGGLSPYAEQAKAGAFLDRNLGTALTLSGKGSGLEAEGGPAREIMKQLGAAYERETGEKFEGSVAAKEIAQGLQGKDDKELREALKDPQKLEALQEDLKGSLGEVNEVFKQAAEMLDSHNSMLAQAYMDHLKLEQEYISKQQSLADQRFSQQEAERARLGQDPATNAEVQANFMQKQEMAIKGVKGIGGLSQERQAQLTAAGGVGSVDAVGQVFKDISAELQASNAAIATAAEQAGVAPDDMKTATNLADSQKELIEKNKQLQAEYDTTKGVLESYANSQQRLIALNRELQAAQGKRKTLKDLAVSMKYGTAEEKDQAQRTMNALAIAQTEGIEAVAPELQKTVIGLLEQMGQGDILDKELEADGYGGEGITQVSAEEKRISAEMSQIEKAGIKAGEIMGQEIGMRAETMATTIEDLHSKFLGDLKTLLAEDAQASAEEDKLMAEAEGSKATEQKEVITKAAGQLGMTYEQFTQDQEGEAKGTADKRMEALLRGALTSDVQDEAQKRVDVMASASRTLASKGGFSDFAQVLDYDNDDADNFGGLGMGDVFGMTGEDLRDKMETALDEGWGNNEEIAELTKDQNSALGDLLRGLKKQYVESGMGTGKDFLTLTGNVVEGLGGSENADASTLLGGILDQMHATAKEAKVDIRDNKEFRKNIGVSETKATKLTDEEQRKIKDVKSASDIDTRAAKAQEDIKVANKQIKASQTALEDVEKEKAAAKEIKAKREAETKAKFQDAAPGADDDGIAATNVEANTDAAATSLASLDKQASSVGSLYTHDIHCEVLLQAILAELQGKDSEAVLDAGLKRNAAMVAQEAVSTPVQGMGNGASSEVQRMADEIISSFNTPEAQALVEDLRQAEANMTAEQRAERKKKFREEYGDDVADVVDQADLKTSGGINQQAGRSSISTANLNDTIEKFSMATEELAGVMGNALTIEVGGTIDVNVNMNGAEFLNGAKDSLGKYAAQQVTKGINNFITQGLKNNSVKTRPDWVNEGGTNDIPGSNNNESGSM
tara:strand:+ start:11064 stop:18152 length:7089 start_codon:yes stop_codon:yes gene_type:complete